MKKFDFATAKNGRTKKWTHEKLSLKKIIKYLQTERRVDVTESEYAGLEKTEKADVKNGNPSFLGGYFEGRRTSVTMRTRSIIALDIDRKFPTNFATFMKKNSIYPYYIYESLSSTKKHRKYRLLFFLSDDVEADLYEPLARRIARNLEIIDYVDNTCYRKTQLMYSPVFCSDTEKPINKFVSVDDAETVSTAELMASFDDIHDQKSWDAAADEGALRKQNNMRLQDPREKAGIVGAFCDYMGDIHAAIAAYDLPYKQESSDRYTYEGGDSSNGFVVYDDGQWAYSNHESDPAAIGGHDLNAFDLVRIHLFGEKDSQKKIADGGYTDPTNAPSFKAMVDLLDNDNDFKEVAGDRVAEKSLQRIFNVDDDFDLDDDEKPAAKEKKVSRETMIINGRSMLYDPMDDPKFKKKHRKAMLKLARASKTDKMIADKNNLFTYLRYAPSFRNRILYDTFRRAVVFVGAKPWKNTKDIEWTDIDTTMLGILLEKEGAQYSKQDLFDTVMAVAFANEYSSLKDFFLHHLPAWDGRERLDKLFVDCLGAEDNEVNAMIAEKTLLGGLERALNDEESHVHAVAVLQGGQRIGKSTFWRKLCPVQDWFSDSKINIGHKDGQSILGGSFIVEMSEFAAVKRADRDEVKAYISSAKDKYRPSFGRNDMIFVRHNIFVGSVNDDEFLSDPTGNGRFKVVHCEGIGTSNLHKIMTQDYVLQVWAEAMQRRADGVEFFYNESQEIATEEVAKQFLQTSSYDDYVRLYITSNKPDDWLLANEPEQQLEILEDMMRKRWKKKELTVKPEKWFTLADVCKGLGIRQQDMHRSKIAVSRAIMSVEGVSKVQKRINGTRIRGYKYKPAD